MRTPAARGAALCQWAVLGTLAPAILLALLPGYAMDLPFRLLCAGVETLLALCMAAGPGGPQPCYSGKGDFFRPPVSGRLPVVRCIRENGLPLYH